MMLNIDWTQLIGWIGVLFGVSISIPQVIQIYRTHSSKDVSAWTYRLLVATTLCYLVRAIAIREPIFIVSNTLSFLIACWFLY